MYQITVLPGMLLVIIGIFLFIFLLNAIGYLDSRYLKKQKKSNIKDTKSKKVILIIIYILLLVSIILSAGFFVKL